MAKYKAEEIEKFAKGKLLNSSGKPFSILSIDITGKGVLVARRVQTGVRYYYQYKLDGKLSRHPFGMHDGRYGSAKASDTAVLFTFPGAKLQAEVFSVAQVKHGDLIGYLREERLLAEAAVNEKQIERELLERATQNYSLAKLCMAYSDHLKADGKASAATVRGSLTNWVIEEHPKLAAKKASDVTTEDVLTILRVIIEAGHKTTVNRVRSYLSAAYTFGLGSATDPLASSRAGGFRLTSNPVAPVKRVAKFESAGERVLSGDELGELLRRLDSKATPAAKAVVLSLRLGGQRIMQLLAVSSKDYDRDNSTVTLKDSKGRRTQARPHLLPVVATAQPLLVDALANPHVRRAGLYSGLAMDTVSKVVRDISKEQEAQGAQPYSWRDLRRTCETMLASMGISKDLRAQLQSHGLSGVQDRHYDKHQYINEKRAALEAWNARLDELKAGTAQASNVVRLSR